MSTKTSNFGFTKLELTDVADITLLNQNWDSIDKELKSTNTNVNQNAEDIAKLTNVTDQHTENLDDLQASKLVNGISASCEGSGKSPFANIKVFGKSVQDGTPSPTAPVDIVSVSNKINLVVEGKNLFQIDENTINGVSLSKFNDYYVLNGTATESANFVKSIGFLPSGTYTLSANNPTNNGVNWSLIDVYSSSPYGVLAVNDNTNYAKKTVILPKSSEYLCRIRIEKGVTYSNFVIKPQLELGSVATEYEPFKEVKSLIVSNSNDLCGVPVESGGNYTDKNGQEWVCDEIDLNRGVYIQRVGVLSLTSTDASRVFTNEYTGNGIAFDNVLTEDLYRAEGLCNFGTIISNFTTSGFLLGNTNKHVYWSGIMTQLNLKELSDFQDWFDSLDNNVLNIYYVLKTPIETTLTSDEIRSYGELYSYNPNTTVLNDSGAEMEVEYITQSHEGVVKVIESVKQSMGKTITQVNKRCDVTTIPSDICVLYTATSDCIVDITVTQGLSDGLPNLTGIKHVYGNNDLYIKQSVSSQTENPTQDYLGCHGKFFLSTGEKLKLFASSVEGGSATFTILTIVEYV